MELRNSNPSIVWFSMDNKNGGSGLPICLGCISLDVRIPSNFSGILCLLQLTSNCWNTLLCLFPKQLSSYKNCCFGKTSFPIKKGKNTKGSSNNKMNKKTLITNKKGASIYKNKVRSTTFFNWSDNGLNLTWSWQQGHSLTIPCRVFKSSAKESEVQSQVSFRYYGLFQEWQLGACSSITESL